MGLDNASGGMPPLDTHVFIHRSLFPGTLAAMQAFHAAPDVFRHLVPPPLRIQIHDDRRTSLTAGEIEFTIWFGFVPVRWLARHEAGGAPHGFRDEMVRGPLARWTHDHIFEETAGGVRLTDRITLAHQPGWRGWLTRLAFHRALLRLLFAYRHWQTRRLIKIAHAHLDSSSQIS
jgi:ligand-binding SRPBCC domain-containing protein